MSNSFEYPAKAANLNDDLNKWHSVLDRADELGCRGMIEYCPKIFSISTGTSMMNEVARKLSEAQSFNCGLLYGHACARQCEK
jgi:hypothetical protein